VRRAGYGQVAAISFVTCLIVGSLAVRWARSGQRPAGCAPLTAAAVVRDDAWTEKFAAYGDDNARLDDWTGADGTWSVPLPGGRTVWIFADTFLGRVEPAPNPRGQGHAWRAAAAPLIHNSAIVQDRDGALTTTLHGTAAGGVPAAWLGPGAVYWPMSAVLDGGALRVFVQSIGPADRRHPYGVVRGAAIATVSPHDLNRARSITPLPAPRRDAAGEQVFYGLGAVRAGGYVYVYGATSNTTRGGQSAYLARVRAGRVAHVDEWEYWHGRDAAGAGTADAATGEWGRDAAGARPVLPFVPHRTGVGPGLAVVRRHGTYVLFTMDPTRPAGGISHIASYWSCEPAGPWHGPAPVYDPPEVVRGGTTLAYFPFAHPEQGGPGLLLSYDVNDTRRAHDDVGLYRPKFIRVTLR
jgi:hypothetical protein